MTTRIDRASLADLAKKVRQGVILEIGSKTGNSALAMAEVAKVPVYCIDLWDLTFPDDNRLEIHRNLENYGLFKEKTKGLRVRPIKGLSAEIAKAWNRPIGLLFIDGDHSFAGCMADYKDFSRHIIKGGYLVFHDYSEKHPDVMRAVNQIQQLSIWKDWHQAGTSLISARRA